MANLIVRNLDQRIVDAARLGARPIRTARRGAVPVGDRAAASGSADRTGGLNRDGSRGRGASTYHGKTHVNP